MGRSGCSRSGAQPGSFAPEHEEEEPDGCREIVFTSGATEANNLAIKGVAAAHSQKGRRLVTQATEHHAVLDTMKRLAGAGFEVTCLPVSPGGRMARRRLRGPSPGHDPGVNHVGQQRDRNGAAGAGDRPSLPRTWRAVPHRCHAGAGALPDRRGGRPLRSAELLGPQALWAKGCGGLYVRRRHTPLKLCPQLDGGGQEGGLRSGTLNVPGIVGLGEACAIAAKEMHQEMTRIAGLRDRLEGGLRERCGGVSVNGDAERSPISPTSPSQALTVPRCWSCSTTWQSAPAPRATAIALNQASSCARWAWNATSHTAPSASASGGSRARRTLIMPWTG